MNCVILQPSYIPWRGYFHQIQRADVFVFYDDVQFDKNGWRNRNRIRTANGSIWLTIPVRHLGLGTPIDQVPIDWTQNWAAKHLGSIRQNYSKAPAFKQCEPLLESIYARRDPMLADFTIESTIAVARALGIEKTRFVRSSSIPANGAKTDRILSILTQLGATRYISGPSARDYIEADKFSEAGIALEYMSYDYPEYAQLHRPFDPQVSILDPMLCAGADAGRLIWGP